MNFMRQPGLLSDEMCGSLSILRFQLKIKFLPEMIGDEIYSWGGMMAREPSNQFYVPTAKYTGRSKRYFS